MRVPRRWGPFSAEAGIVTCWPTRSRACDVTKTRTRPPGRSTRRPARVSRRRTVLLPALSSGSRHSAMTRAGAHGASPGAEPLRRGTRRRARGAVAARCSATWTVNRGGVAGRRKAGVRCEGARPAVDLVEHCRGGPRWCVGPPCFSARRRVFAQLGALCPCASTQCMSARKQPCSDSPSFVTKLRPIATCRSARRAEREKLPCEGDSSA